MTLYNSPPCTLGSSGITEVKYHVDQARDRTHNLKVMSLVLQPLSSYVLVFYRFGIPKLMKVIKNSYVKSTFTVRVNRVHMIGVQKHEQQFLYSLAFTMNVNKEVKLSSGVTL